MNYSRFTQPRGATTVTTDPIYLRSLRKFPFHYIYWVDFEWKGGRDGKGGGDMFIIVDAFLRDLALHSLLLFVSPLRHVKAHKFVERGRRILNSGHDGVVALR